MVESSNEGSHRDTTFQDLLDSEQLLVARRRESAGRTKDAPTVGLALSGGGIRSATFCLGFLQALSSKRLLTRVDYLSTVSGGSYVGAFFGALFVPSAFRGFAAESKRRPHFDKSMPLQSELGLEAVRRLRDSGRYLTPSGTSDAFFGAAVVLRNWTAVQTVIGLTVLLAFWCLRLLDNNWSLVDSGSFSPALVVLTLLAFAVVLACGSAYWLTRRELIPKSRIARIASNLFFWAFSAGFAFMVWRVANEPTWRIAFSFDFLQIFISVFMGLAVLTYLVAEGLHGKFFGVGNASSAPHHQLLIAAEDKVRTALSNTMATALTWALILFGLLLLDFGGSGLASGFTEIFHPETPFEMSLTVSGMVDFAKHTWPVLVAIAPPLLSFVARRQLKKQNAEITARATGTSVASRLPALLVLAGSTVVALWLVLWSAVSHFAFAEASGLRLSVWPVAVALLLINVIQSLCFSFINLSSLSTFYASRLRRAYIGASSYGNDFTSVRKDDPQDTIRVEDYYRSTISEGAPLHIINVTIAETIAGSSNLVARDRKGKPMQLTPCGIAYEDNMPGRFIAHEGSWGEDLPLANWIAISGAAVSAAIGAGTSLGTSILATMANVRLGYWWKARDVNQAREYFWKTWKDTVQNYLFLELRGAFDGTRRNRWYLTDGGHFENTGLYALLQRKVDFVISCDNGADPSYNMLDVLRLVQRARIDLGVEITFLNEESISTAIGAGSPLQGWLGPLAALARPGDFARPGGPIAAVANVRYACGKMGTLLLIKPRLTFSEPPELLAYRSSPGGADFPQQTTGDQFFDEEQWEAYRRLGELCGERLFIERGDAVAGWYPSDFRP